MELIKAASDDLKRIMELYADIIDNTENIETYARWKKNIHPAEDEVREYINADAMYLLVDGGQIAGAMAVIMKQDEEYDKIVWETDAKSDEVAVIHILGVNPQWQRRGIGRKLVDHAIELAQKYGKKAVRLDALESNKPAQKMYQDKGFICQGKMKMYAGNTGWIDFLFYEYGLK